MKSFILKTYMKHLKTFNPFQITVRKSQVFNSCATQCDANNSKMPHVRSLKCGSSISSNLELDHIPVMAKEVINALEPKDNQVWQYLYICIYVCFTIIFINANLF